MARITLNLPFTYIVSGRKKHTSEDRSYLVVDRMKVEIPDLPATEVPTAVEVDGKVVARSFGGHPVQEMKPAGLWRRNQILDLAELERWLTQAKLKDLVESPPTGFLPARKPESFDGQPQDAKALHMNRIDFSDEDHAKDTMAKFVSKLVFVDGILHGPSAEPVYQIRRELSGEKKISVASGFNHSFDERVAATFRLDRLVEAERFAAQLYGNDLRCEKPALDHGLIEWNFDEERDVSLTLYRSLLTSVAGQHISYAWQDFPSQIFGLMDKLTQDIPLKELSAEIDLVRPHLEKVPVWNRYRSVCDRMLNAMDVWQDRVRLVPPPRARLQDPEPAIRDLVI